MPCPGSPSGPWTTPATPKSVPSPAFAFAWTQVVPRRNEEMKIQMHAHMSLQGTDVWQAEHHLAWLDQSVLTPTVGGNDIFTLEPKIEAAELPTLPLLLQGPAGGSCWCHSSSAALFSPRLCHPHAPVVHTRVTASLWLLGIGSMSVRGVSGRSGLGRPARRGHVATEHWEGHC